MITDKKFLILEHCKHTPHSPSEVAAALNGNRHTLRCSMAKMVRDEFMVTDNGMYQTTALGRIEMRKYKDTKACIVPAPKIDKFEGVYTSPIGYQRNTGLKEISSRGVSC